MDLWDLFTYDQWDAENIPDKVTVVDIFVLSLVHVPHQFPIGGGLFSIEESERWKEIKKENINVQARQFW